MHMLIEFDYSDQWAKMSEDTYAKLKEHFPTLPENKPNYTPGGTHQLTDDNKDRIIELGLPIRISKDSGYGIGQMLVKLQDKIDRLEGKVDECTLAELERKGAAVQIHIPDLLLNHVRQVEVLEDACTQMVQEYLDNGWRILAVCPPNAQRRPDYIIGRNHKGEQHLGHDNG